MAKTIRPVDLEKVLQQELDVYSRDLTDRVNAAGAAAIKKLKKLTKANAPVDTGSFKKNIAVKEETNELGVKRFVWYVKPPDHRLTHLLVHGHATRTGGRTRANPFLKNALAQVLPEYEENVKEAIKE